MGTTSNEKKKSSTQKSVKNLSDVKKTQKGRLRADLSRGKKIWSFDVLLEAMKPSEEELEYRKQKSEELLDLQIYIKLFQCTKCQKSFDTILKKHQKVPVHPCLGVLMCQNCCDYYEDGEFSLDSDGEDKYCRWCGEGGTIFGCWKCICGFCAKCIKRHFKPDYFKKVLKDDNWLCFFCDPKPLWDLRYICSLAVEISKSQRTLNFSSASKKSEKSLTTFSAKSSEQSSPNPKSNPKQVSDSNNSTLIVKKSTRKRIFSISSDESETEGLKMHKKKLKSTGNSSEDSSEKKERNSFKSMKLNVLNELEKILNLSKYQMSFGASWTSKMLKQLQEPDEITSSEELAKKCQKIKWFLSILSSYLVQFCNSVDSLEKNLLADDELKGPLDFPNNEKPSYITILQFLGFVNNQIKTFMEKGISLSDVLEAEVYNDDNIIGIKKKFNSVKPTFNQNKSSRADGSKSFKNDEYEDSESKEGTDEQKGEDDDRSRDENSLEIVFDQSSDMICTEGDDELKSLNCSNLTLEEANYLKNADPKEDIQKILAILENA